MKDDIYSAICREALESRQRDLMSFVDNGMAGLSIRLEKTLLRLPSGYFLLGLGPYNAGLVKLDFDELLIGREVPEYIGVGMPVSGFRVSSPDAFLNVEVSRLHAKVVRRLDSGGALYRLVDMRSTCGTYLNGDPIPGARRSRRDLRRRLRSAPALRRFLLARPVVGQSLPLLPEVTSEASRGPSRGIRLALLVGSAAAFVAAIALARRIGPALLADPEAAWAPSRLLLGLAVAAGAAAAGARAAAGFLAWARSAGSAEELAPIPFRASTLAALTLLAMAAGTALRFAALERVPEWLWVDDLSLMRPALELSGRPSDFSDSIRPLPYGVPKPYGSIGVLYLEGYRAALALGGTTVLGVRLPSALAGAASLVTAALLGRALLPAGGGMLTALVLAGLRWHLILSRWAFNMILLAPIVDLATLALLSSRKRRSVPRALAAGVVGGLGAHVYLSAWPAGAALGLFALWPAEAGEKAGARVARAAAFALGFAACAAPLFLFREGRAAPYFARTADHNVLLEIRRTGSLRPPFEAVADALVSPWLLGDPTPRHDLPGRTRLGWILGIPVAIALGRALLRPRDAISGLLLAHAAAFLAAVAAGGQADNPNGSRFAYLSTLTAVAAAAGVLWILGRVPPRSRRAAALAAVGAIAVDGSRLGARGPADLARTRRDVPGLPRGGHAHRPGGGALGPLRKRGDRARSRAFEPGDRGRAPIPAGSLYRRRRGGRTAGAGRAAKPGSCRRRPTRRAESVSSSGSWIPAENPGP